MQEKHPFKGILYSPGGAAIGAGTTVFEDPNGKPINRDNLTKKQQNELDIFLKHKSGKTNNKLKIKKNR